MNLQRYISTVYSEIIPEKYYNDTDAKDKNAKDNINIELNKIDDKKTFKEIRNLYTIQNTPYTSTDKNKEYLLHTLFFEIIFGKNLESLHKKTSNSVFIFPIFFDIDDSSRRFSDILGPIYKNFLGHKTSQEFNRTTDGNMVLYVPAFADGDDEPAEFKERLTSYFERAFTFINDIRQKKASNTYGKVPDKFETIIYTIDKENQFFTGYYKKKLKEENIKTLNRIVEKFVEKFGCRISSIKDPILKLTRDESRKKIISDGKKIEKIENLENFYQLVDKFNDIYKKTNDKEYLKLASSTENQTKYRIYYRVNNTDIVDNFSEIKPGSSYVYKITDGDKICRIGYFKERRGTTNQFIFREYKGLSNVQCDTPSKDAKKELEEEEDKDFKDDAESKMEEYIIETKNYGTIIKYKRVIKGDYKPIYSGVVEPFMDLHIYEKYKWFQFNEIDGTLSPETNIKIYKNILFDKKSLIEFLKEKKLFTDKTRLAVEFLKINLSNTLLSEYVDFILTNKKNTNVYEQTLFSGKLESFVEKNKKSILDILFQTNELIYLNPQRTSQTKENIKQNYKIITYNYYPSIYKSDIDHHFNKVIYEDEEQKYCKKKECELTDKLIESSESSNIEYSIAIVDVTKDNVEVAEDLKAKTTCKKLRRTLRKQLQPFLQALMPRIGGRLKRLRSKKLRTRRRKNRH
jgi:hypothetical protein